MFYTKRKLICFVQTSENENNLLIHPCLQSSLNDSVRSNNIHNSSPTTVCISIDRSEETLRNDLKELFWLHVILVATNDSDSRHPQCFTGSVEALCASGRYSELRSVDSRANGVHCIHIRFTILNRRDYERVPYLVQQSQVL